MESYYYNSSTILRYLRKVLNEIHRDYVDSGLRAGFIMKRFAQKYKLNSEIAVRLVLLCMLKDIGCFYQDGNIPKDNPALSAASGYTFLKHCSPLGDGAKPLLFYKARYIDGVDNDEYYCGMLMTLINQVVMYNFSEYTLDEIEEFLKNDSGVLYNPDQVKKVLKLLRDEEDILEKLNQKNSIFIHETCSYIQNANYTEEELLKYIDMTNFSFEFHNHETLAHTVTTAVIAKEIAKLSRLTENQINCIYLAALVHDIGKIRIPISILCNPNKLEGEDLKEMRRHVEYTKEILEGSFSYKIVEMAANHHEKLDGSGYPRGLKAIDLSIGDKILSLADVISALYCKRSYKASFSIDRIINILKEDVDSLKLDGRLVNHFINNSDAIMKIAKEKEAEVLACYENMQAEYSLLSKSKQLHYFFEEDYSDVVSDDKICETIENVDKKSYEEYKANDDSDLEEDESFKEENESNNELNYSEETELESYIDEDNELEEDFLDYEEEL